MYGIGSMVDKLTSELNKTLAHTKIEDFAGFVDKNKDAFIKSGAFRDYVSKLLKEKKISRRDVFIEADISDRYGYKLLSGEKRTNQRDVIIRICYAASFSIEETQMALRLYRLPELYPRIPRDAFLIACFIERPGNINEINELLVENNFDAILKEDL